jgi:hypothetical protein
MISSKYLEMSFSSLTLLLIFWLLVWLAPGYEQMQAASKAPSIDAHIQKTWFDTAGKTAQRQLKASSGEDKIKKKVNSMIKGTMLKNDITN